LSIKKVLVPAPGIIAKLANFTVLATLIHHVPLHLGVIGYVGSTVGVVLNGLRLLRDVPQES
jgi:cation transport ATPase